MIQYLLDTNICIYHIKGLYNIDKKIGLKTISHDLQLEPATFVKKEPLAAGGIGNSTLQVLLFFPIYGILKIKEVKAIQLTVVPLAWHFFSFFSFFLKFVGKEQYLTKPGKTFIFVIDYEKSAFFS